jgi:hypothetical protein
MSAELLNTQLRVLSLTAIGLRYYINISTDHAEKTGLMAYVGAKKANDELWQFMSGNLLAGPNPK